MPGIAFDFTAKPVIAPLQPPRETIKVRAVRPERDQRQDAKEKKSTMDTCWIPGTMRCVIFTPEKNMTSIHDLLHNNQFTLSVTTSSPPLKGNIHQIFVLELVGTYQTFFTPIPAKYADKPDTGRIAVRQGQHNQPPRRGVF